MKYAFNTFYACLVVLFPSFDSAVEEETTKPVTSGLSEFTKKLVTVDTARLKIIQKERTTQALKALKLLFNTSKRVFVRKEKVNRYYTYNVSNVVDTFSYRTRPEITHFVKTMHPTVRKRFHDFLLELEENDIKVKVWSAYRGWDWSVAIWKKYPQVRKCCLPGHDYHFFGLAIDIAIVLPNGEYLGNSSSREKWESTGVREIARKYKLQWGIDFDGYYDPVHFAFPYKDISSLVSKAEQTYGSLKNTPGNRMDFENTFQRTWKVA